MNENLGATATRAAIDRSLNGSFRNGMLRPRTSHQFENRYNWPGAIGKSKTAIASLKIFLERSSAIAILTAIADF
ncbi:MAG: hypothetical protein F6J93_13005 [Oscillatoria sp. SIO1A7]|nr:hypothetical protein [Oscillatoria sp. SIO1A7]